MTKSICKDSWRTFLGCVILFLCIMMIAGTVSLSASTLASPSIPIAIAVILAAISAIPLYRMWKWLTRSENFLPNFICHLIVFSSAFSFSIYALNFAFPQEGTRYQIKATVEKKISKTRHHSKRVGRRYTTQGEPYKVYEIEVRLPDSVKKDFSVNVERYIYSHKGDTVILNAEKGMFGIVTLRLDTEIKRPKHKHSRHRNLKLQDQFY